MTNTPAKGEIYTDSNRKARRKIVNVYVKADDGTDKVTILHKNGSGTNTKETELQEFLKQYKRIDNE